MKRPYVDEFLDYMGKTFECVLFTASLSKVHNSSSISLFVCNFSLLSLFSMPSLFPTSWTRAAVLKQSFSGNLVSITKGIMSKYVIN